MVDPSRRFYNDVLMYSTYNEGKPIVAEMFIRPLKGKTYKQIWQQVIIVLILIVYTNLYMNAIIQKLQYLKLVTDSGLLSISIFLGNVTLKNDQRKHLWLSLYVKLILGGIELNT